MIDKQYLIKLTGEDNIWYDSEERVYRRRMHCPECGKVSGCLCYEDLDMAEIDEDEDLDYTCSSKCALDGGEWGDLYEAMQAAGIRRKISEFTDEELKTSLQNFERKNILEAMQDCSIFKHISALTKEDVVRILEHYSADVDEMDIDRGKDIKDLTEDEAKRVLDILTEDAEFDNYPSGDVCRT